MVDEAYLDQKEWVKKSIRTTAKVISIHIMTNTCADKIGLQMGKFSTDRAIQDYAQEYWNIESAKV